MAAMVYGGLEHEHLQLNEDTLVSGEPPPDLRTIDIRNDRDKVVAMLREGRYVEAGVYVAENWLGRSQPCYQPMGDLHIEHDFPNKTFPNTPPPANTLPSANTSPANNPSAAQTAPRLPPRLLALARPSGHDRRRILHARRRRSVHPRETRPRRRHAKTLRRAPRAPRRRLLFLQI
jgi:hypothetical protein